VATEVPAAAASGHETAPAPAERRPKRDPPLPRKESTRVARARDVAPPAERPSAPAPKRVAEAAPAPAPAAAPAKRSSDPLLDVGGDDELERELSGGKAKRSVFVPPAIGSDLPESVSVSQINEAVVGQKAALLRCIEQQKGADAEARGTLRIRWIIQGDGSTRDVKVLSDEFARQPIAPCISGVVKGLRFPRSRTAGQEVVFPFKF
jgi:hypothetical protein